MYHWTNPDFSKTTHIPSWCSWCARSSFSAGKYWDRVGCSMFYDSTGRLNGVRLIYHIHEQLWVNAKLCDKAHHTLSIIDIQSNPSAFNSVRASFPCDGSLPLRWQGSSNTFLQMNFNACTAPRSSVENLKSHLAPTFLLNEPLLLVLDLNF